jgi:hypothetical protein
MFANLYDAVDFLINKYLLPKGDVPIATAAFKLNLFYFDTQINALPDAPMIITSLNRQTPVNTSKTDNSSMLPFACPLDANDPGPVIAQFVMTGCNLEDLTAGAITIWVCYATLP